MALVGQASCLVLQSDATPARLTAGLILIWCTLGIGVPFWQARPSMPSSPHGAERGSRHRRGQGQAAVTLAQGAQCGRLGAMGCSSGVLLCLVLEKLVLN